MDESLPSEVVSNGSASEPDTSLDPDDPPAELREEEETPANKFVAAANLQTREETLLRCARNGHELMVAPERFRGDRDIVMAAVKK